MSKKNKFFLIVFFGCISLSFTLIQTNFKLVDATKSNASTLISAPRNLTIEFIRDTKGVKIIDPTPEYSWEVPKEVTEQSAYQILVASSKKAIKSNIGDVWNSGKVTNNSSTNISYQGDTLEEGKTYYWTVRIWNGKNISSTYAIDQSFIIGKANTYISTRNSFKIDSIMPKVFLQREQDYFLDFGKAAFANLCFTYEAKTNDTLTFRIGEQLENASINRAPSKKSNIRYQEIKVPVIAGKKTYLLPITPDKRNTLKGKALPLPSGFPVLMPFRYAEVEGVQGVIKANDFIQLAYHSYWEDTASNFISSDTILNQVWDLCKYSIKATTFNGLYVDGDRERIPYEADAYLNQLSHYSVDQEYAMARQTIEYFMSNPTWPTEWQQHMALMFYADYMYTGNTELIKKYYQQLKHKTLMELSREDGLISSTKATPEFMKKLGFKNKKDKLKDITDWPPANWGGDPKVTGERDGFVFMPYNTVVNAFYYKNMLIMAEFANILGKKSEAIAFTTKAEKVKKTINSKLFDAEKGYYIDGEGTEHASIHANMMPLAFGLVPEEYKSSVVKFVKSRGMACSVYGAQYLMEALYNANEEDYALQLLTSTSKRSWYNMIRIGSTITLEAWDMQYKPNADWNHAWGAVPANAIPRGLWGIMPKTPGYGIATINPQLGGLENSKIEVPTLKGKIKATYFKDAKGTKKYRIDIPGNMVAEFNLKNLSSEKWRHNGKKIKANSKPILLFSGTHEIEISK